MLKEFGSNVLSLFCLEISLEKKLRSKLHQKEITKKKLASAKNEIQNSMPISTDQQTP